MKKNGRFSVLMLAAVLLAVGVYSTALAADPSLPGEFSKCTYTSNLSDPGYSSAIVYYPCDRSAGPYAATTLTGGFLNTKEDMEWIANHLVTHGYIIIAMTPTNIFGTNPTWTTAHKAGIAKLKSENTRAASPIYGLVDTANLQIMGYSKGGGGALLASASLGSQIKTTQAMAPYMDYSYNLSGITAKTICYTGTSDTVASPSKVVTMYNSLSDSITRTLAYFDGFSHLTWVDGGNSTSQSRAKTYITSWMKVYLDGDTAYSIYIDGHQDWFYAFAEDEDYIEGGGGCN